MKYHIILSDKDRHLFKLSYELFDHRVTREWIRLTQNALRNHAVPTGQSFNFQVTPADFKRVLNEMNDHLHVIRNEQILPMNIPSLSAENISQHYLNELHKSFHRFEEMIQQKNIFRHHFYPRSSRPLIAYSWRDLGLFSATRTSLGRLNTLIHWVENAYKMLGGEHINQFFNFFLHPNSFAPLMSSDYELFRISLNFGDLMLGYGTTGKNLYHCYIDNDHDVVRAGLIRPQKTISTEVIAFFPLVDAAPEFEREQNERFRNWCEQAEVHKYGYDLDLPEHRIGHVPLGKLITPLSLQGAQEIFGRYTEVVGCEFSD